MSETTLHRAVLDFWTQAGSKSWFAKDESFDLAIKDQFEALHHAAARSEIDDWAADWQGALALILLLDQFPRNLYRQSAHAFATDGKALRIAQDSIARGLDQQAPMPLRIFFYLPLEHAEDLQLQQRCLSLMQAAGDPSFAQYAQLHLNVIAQFGRFPHRNNALGRAATPDEIAFLAKGGFAG